MAITRRGVLTADRQTTADLAGWNNQGDLPDISNAQARTGSYSYQATVTTRPFGKAIPATGALRLGFALRHNGYTNAYLYMATAGLAAASSTGMIGIRFDSGDGMLRVLRFDGALLTDVEELAAVAVPVGFTANGWHQIGIAHKIDAAAGFLSLYLNGTRILNHVGDTRLAYYSGGAQQYLTQAGYALVAGEVGNSNLGWGSYTYVDDYYVDDITGEADAAPDAARFYWTAVSGAGSLAQWTPVGDATNHGAVDDAVPDGDTTYVKATGAGLLDRFALADPPVPADHQVAAVTPLAAAKRLDTNVDSRLTLQLHDGVNLAESADLVLPSDYTEPVWQRFATAPDGGPWTEAKVNALTAGYKSSGTF